MTSNIPLIDISPLIQNNNNNNNNDDNNNDLERKKVARKISEACREHGFFYIIGHGVDISLQNKLKKVCKEFFSLPHETKMKISMQENEKYGINWCGYFPLGDEITSGKPDIKEGIYFGEQDENAVNDNKILYKGKNLFPEQVAEFKETILEYMNTMVCLAHKIMEGIALSLGLNDKYFYDRYTSSPMQIFAALHYPAMKELESSSESLLGTGEHTDYGLLTILRQDEFASGLQVKSKNEWIDAPPIENSFVCNIGDMLDRMTGGLYKSTLHRVKVQTKNERTSFPFFFDPNFYSQIKPIEGITNIIEDNDIRWDKVSVYEFNGTYGDYILNKLSKSGLKYSTSTNDDLN